MIEPLPPTQPHTHPHPPSVPELTTKLVDMMKPFMWQIENDWWLQKWTTPVSLAVVPPQPSNWCLSKLAKVVKRTKGEENGFNRVCVVTQATRLTHTSSTAVDKMPPWWKASNRFPHIHQFGTSPVTGGKKRLDGGVPTGAPPKWQHVGRKRRLNGGSPTGAPNILLLVDYLVTPHTGVLLWPSYFIYLLFPFLLIRGSNDWRDRRPDLWHSRTFEK